MDEHVDDAVADGLRRRGIDATTTSDAGLRGADDLAHVTFANSEVRVIVTSDTDFLLLHDLGTCHPGIAFWRQRSRTIGDAIRGLTLLWEVLEPEEMRNQIEYL